MTDSSPSAAERQSNASTAPAAFASAESFRHRTSFPGTEGGPFDVLIRGGEQVERIPAAVFFIGLFLIAAVPSGGRLLEALPLLSFMAVDWFLLWLLPHLRISYGPTKPQVLALAVLRLPFGFLPGWWFWAVQSLGTALVGYGFMLEPSRLKLERERLVTPKLAAGSSLRIVHLGDLHIRQMRGLDERLLKEIGGLRPDLILFSGDVLSYSGVNEPQAWQAARQVLSSLQARFGVYAVLGSPPVDRPEVVSQILEGTGVRLLTDERTCLDCAGVTIELIGVSCSHRPFEDAEKLKNLIGDDDSDFRILLYHSPDLAPQAATMGVDLQLSGHTHGGQVRLPLYGALYSSSLYGKNFEVGRHRLGDMNLYVTRGIGLEGASAPRVRFLCSPELTVWRVSGPAK